MSEIKNTLFIFLKLVNEWTSDTFLSSDKDRTLHLILIVFWTYTKLYNSVNIHLFNSSLGMYGYPLILQSETIVLKITAVDKTLYCINRARMKAMSVEYFFLQLSKRLPVFIFYIGCLYNL